MASRPTGEDALPVRSSSTLLPVGVEAAELAVRALAAQLWEVSTVVEQPGLFVQRVADGAAGDPSCWLTWTFEVVDAQTTKVWLLHAELEVDGPPPELDFVLAALLRQHGQEIARAGAG
jgi:hypothetical protein